MKLKILKKNCNKVIFAKNKLEIINNVRNK